MSLAVLSGAIKRGLPRSGLVALYDFARVNGYAYTETTTNWNINAVTLSMAPDPLGGMKAIRATLTGGSNVHAARPPVAVTYADNETVSYSVYLRVIGIASGFMGVEVANKATFLGLIFNTNTNTTTTTLPSWISRAVMTDSTIYPGWKCVEVTFNTGTGASTVRATVHGGTYGTYSGDGQYFDIFQPQLNRGSIVLPYEYQSDGQTLLDRSGNGYNATLGATSGVDTSDPTWTTTGLSFDGTDDYALASAPSSYAGLTAITVIIPTANQSGSPVAQWGANQAWMFQPLSSNSMAARFLVKASTSGIVTASGSYIPTIDGTTPYVMVGVHDGSRAYAWYYGRESKPAGSVAVGTITGATTSLYFGRESGAALFFKGVNAYTVIYNRALSDAEISQAYKAIKKTLAARGVTI